MNYKALISGTIILSNYYLNNSADNRFKFDNHYGISSITMDVTDFSIADFHVQCLIEAGWIQKHKYRNTKDYLPFKLSEYRVDEQWTLQWENSND